MAIRILHVAQAAGGVDRYIRMLLKYLDKDKFENILVCSQDFKKEDYEGLVDAFEQIEMNRAIGVKDLKLIWKVRKLIKKYNPDIVYAHSSKAGAIARIADIGCKNYCVYNPHGWAFNMRCSDKKRIMYIAIESIAIYHSELFLCEIIFYIIELIFFFTTDVLENEKILYKCDLNISKKMAYIFVTCGFILIVLAYPSLPTFNTELERDMGIVPSSLVVPLSMLLLGVTYDWLKKGWYFRIITFISLFWVMFHGDRVSRGF